MIIDKFKKFKPSSHSLMTFLIFLLVIDLILLAFLNRKPMCIESSLIDQIEWVTEQSKIAKIYKCQLEKKSELNEIIIEKLDDLQRRIKSLEALLKSNFIPKRSIKLVVHESNTNTVQISADTIIIDKEILFNKKLSLESAFIKAWLQQYQKKQSQGLGLMRLDILTHFLLWNLGVNQHFELKWQNILTKWPQSATTWSGYCHSEIKDDIYSSLCSNPTLNQDAELFIPLSTAFWFAQKLWFSFQLLAMSEQINFFKTISNFVEILSESESQDINEMTLNELQKFILTEVQTWKFYLNKVGLKEWGNNFEVKVSFDLDGNSDNLGRADLLIKKSGIWSPKELQRYQDLSFEELNYRILALNSEGFWNLPWLAPIKSTSLPSIKVTYLVWLTCDWPSAIELLDLQEHSEKVIVVKNQCPSGEEKNDIKNIDGEPLIYSGLLHRGLQFFSLDNQDVQFVQINLEGLRFLIKKDNSLKEKRLGAFQQINERTHYLASKANWISALWNQQYRAYEVQATIDVIEWFKLPDNTWPDFTNDQ